MSEIEKAVERLEAVHTAACNLVEKWFKGLDPVSYRISVIAVTRDLISLMEK